MDVPGQIPVITNTEEGRDGHVCQMLQVPGMERAVPMSPTQAVMTPERTHAWPRLGLKDGKCPTLLLPLPRSHRDWQWFHGEPAGFSRQLLGWECLGTSDSSKTVAETPPL